MSGEFVPDQVLVRLEGLPVALHREAAAHLDGLLREFDVVMAGDDADSLPGRLRALVEEIDARRGRGADADLPDFLASVDESAERVDLDVWVPVESADVVGRFDAVLDEVEQHCRTGEHLLTLAASPRALAYRRWLLREIVRQVAGAEPQPWDERAALAALSHDERAESPAVPQGWALADRGEEVVVVPAGDLDLQTAPKLRDLVQSLRRDHIRTVELDLRDVTFIDSVGLGMLVSVNQRLDADGVGLAVHVPRRLRRVFDLSGLDRVLDLRDA